MPEYRRVLHNYNVYVSRNGRFRANRSASSATFPRVKRSFRAHPCISYANCTTFLTSHRFCSKRSIRGEKNDRLNFPPALTRGASISRATDMSCLRNDPVKRQERENWTRSFDRTCSSSHATPKSLYALLFPLEFRSQVRTGSRSSRRELAACLLNLVFMQYARFTGLYLEYNS